MSSSEIGDRRSRGGASVPVVPRPAVPAEACAHPPTLTELIAMFAPDSRVSCTNARPIERSAALKWEGAHRWYWMLGVSQPGREYV